MSPANKTSSYENLEKQLLSIPLDRADWYLSYLNFIKNVSNSLKSDSKEFDSLRKKARNFFKEQLKAGKVRLSNHGPNLDKDRKQVDTIVIHHTSSPPRYQLDYLNAVHLLNIYAPYFANPTDEREKSLKGQPIWSGHFKNGQQVFWGYHWLVRMDGTFERLLEDKELGWHSGNWDINCRSVGICLDNDYEDQDPNDITLKLLAKHIAEHYSFVKPQDIIGHCEVRASTICPGQHFLKHWKPKLLKYYKEAL